MSERHLKVLAICPFPVDFPSTRYRVVQYIEPLREHGIDLTVRPFLDDIEYRNYFDDPRLLARLSTIAAPIARRFHDIVRSARADVVFIQREAMPFGPGLFESLFAAVGNTPVVLDIDDAVYIPYNRGRYGRIGSLLKFYGKTERIIRRAHTVVCGGEFLAEYVRKKGGRAVVVPTTVDKEIFAPSDSVSEVPVIGWIGTPSSFRYLEALFPVFAELAKSHRFIVRFRGTGVERIEIDNVSVDNAPWNANTEIEDFRSLDVGLYPLVENADQSLEFIQGKSGFKAIQYLALGIPFVVSPLGVTASIGIADGTHFEARNAGEWVKKLDLLLSDATLRASMGQRGRSYFLENYDLDHWAKVLADVIRQAADHGKRD